MMDDVTHTSIFGNTIDSNGNEGLYVLRGSDNSFASNVIRNNSNGLYIFSSTQVAITDNQVSENYYGMDLNSLTAPASVTGNTIRFNTNDGIRTGSSNDNLIYNNYLNNSKNAVDSGSNDWHIDPVRGKNIMGGSCLGGNFWSDYAGNDTDGDGLGDTITVNVTLVSGESSEASRQITYSGGTGPVTHTITIAIGAAVAVLFRMGVLPPGTAGAEE